MKTAHFCECYLFLLISLFYVLMKANENFRKIYSFKYFFLCTIQLKKPSVSTTLKNIVYKYIFKNHTMITWLNENDSFSPTFRF